MQEKRRRRERERKKRQEEERRRKQEQREAQERERKAREEAKRIREAEEIRRKEEARRKQEAEELARKIREQNQKAEETRQLREARQRQEELIMQQRADETKRLRAQRQQQLQLDERVKQLQNFLSEVYGLNLSDELHSEAESLELEITSLNSIDDVDRFDSLVLVPFVNKCRKYHERFETYLSLVDKYRASAEMVGVECKEVLFDENAEATLTELISSLEERAYTDSKRQYIHNTMNEEMASMGYKVIGSRKMTVPSGLSFTEELYQIDDDGVAASVIYQDNGQISIEIGALRSSSSCEEYPLYDEMPIVLENHQRSFCAKAHKFEEDIAVKGITCSITRQPPNGAYAPSFLIEEYKMQRDVKVLASERNNNFTSASESLSIS